MKSGPCFIIARITLDKMGLIKRVLLLERVFVPGRRWLTRPGPPTGGARGGGSASRPVPVCPGVPGGVPSLPLGLPLLGTSGCQDVSGSPSEQGLDLLPGDGLG